VIPASFFEAHLDNLIERRWMMTTQTLTYQAASVKVDVRASLTKISKMSSRSESFGDALRSSGQATEKTEPKEVKQTAKADKPEKAEASPKTDGTPKKDETKVTDAKAEKPESKETQVTSKAEEKTEVTEDVKLPVLSEKDLNEVNEVMEELMSIMTGFVNNLAQEVLKVPAEQITDWLGDKHKELVDMLSLDTNMQMLMDLNGMTDQSELLTNEEVFGMWSEIKVEVSELRTELQIPDDEDFAQSLIAKIKELAEDKMANIKPADFIVKEDNEETHIEMAAPEIAEELPVLTEADKENGFTFDTENAGMEKQTSKKAVVNNEIQPAAPFIERLTEALTKLEGAKEIFAPQTDSTQILDQVLDSMKVNLNPEETTMELMLHPESLGKVSVQVTSKSGVMTASMNVQTEAAKEALESQLITLKQTFEEQGLKVESVEVNISDFSFTRDDDADRGSKGEQDSKKNRRFLSLDEIKARIAEEGATESESVRRIDPRTSGYRVDYFG